LKTLIIEAGQVYSPGNIELLFYLLRCLDNKGLQTIVYLIHPETIKRFEAESFKCVNVIKTNTIKSFYRYLISRKNIIYFCSHPPISRCTKSIVYYHSSLFTNPKTILFNSKLRIPHKIKRLLVFYINLFFHKKVDHYVCQTDSMLDDLKRNFKNIRVKKMPFYDSKSINDYTRNILEVKTFDFFYPATADTHKNLFNLFDAILILGQHRKISLIVTISSTKSAYIERINVVNFQLGYDAIINIGRVSKEIVIEFYKMSKALVFPSLEESLGLPLIEAASMKLPIIGSDLPYIYDVVETPIVFNPNKPQDIAEKMLNFLEGKYEDVRQSNKINNHIEEIIEYFKY
jgi:glycosyltransferase involved in cell wall biosynthesis